MNVETKAIYAVEVDAFKRRFTNEGDLKDDDEGMTRGGQAITDLSSLSQGVMSSKEYAGRAKGL